MDTKHNNKQWSNIGGSTMKEKPHYPVETNTENDNEYTQCSQTFPKYGVSLPKDGWMEARFNAKLTTNGIEIPKEEDTLLFKDFCR